MYGFQEISVDDLIARQAGGESIRLIDVRSAGETARGIIPGAELFPLHTLPLRLDELRSDIPVVVYCQSGARSAQACAFLVQQGLKNVASLQGGIMAWARSGQAIAAA
ncbi:MAG: rhodanese-like domain-containing protein [Thioalkalivibrionaceae bacterium]